MINRLLQFPSSTGGGHSHPLPPRGPESSSTQRLGQGPVWWGWDGREVGWAMRGALSSLPRHRGIQPRSSQRLFEGKRLSEITNLRKPLPSHLLTSAFRARAPLGLPGGIGLFHS